MKIIYVTDEGGDWAGLYIEGELYDENHSLRLGDVLSELGERGLFEYEHFEMPEDGWELTGGRLPEEFEEIPEGLLE